MTQAEREILQPLYDQWQAVNNSDYIPDLEELVDFFVSESVERTELEPEVRE